MGGGGGGGGREGQCDGTGWQRHWAGWQRHCGGVQRLGTGAVAAMLSTAAVQARRCDGHAAVQRVSRRRGVPSSAAAERPRKHSNGRQPLQAAPSPRWGRRAWAGLRARQPTARGVAGAGTQLHPREGRGKQARDRLTAFRSCLARGWRRGNSRRGCAARGRVVRHRRCWHAWSGSAGPHSAGARPRDLTRVSTGHIVRRHPARSPPVLAAADPAPPQHPYKNARCWQRSEAGTSQAAPVARCACCPARCGFRHCCRPPEADGAVRLGSARRPGG